MNHHPQHSAFRRIPAGPTMWGLALGSMLMVSPLMSGETIESAVVADAPPVVNRRSYDHVDPTDQEQLMLELINRARANPKAEADRLKIGLNDGLASGTISTSPKPPLAAHPDLFRAARKHSQWMLDTDIFSHTGVGNSSPGTRMSAAGYVFSGGWSWSENIAWGGTSGTPDLTNETIARHEGLFRSPGHRTNLCNPTSRNVGLGVRSGRFQGWNAVIATQNFARSGAYPKSLLVGVVFNDHDDDGFYDPGEGVGGVIVVPEGEDWETTTAASGGYAVPYTGTSGTLQVTFRGGPLGASESRSMIRTGNNLKIDLRVSVTASKSPEIAVQQPAGSNLADGTGRRRFGTATTGTKGVTKTFIIKNTGTANLTGLAVSKNGRHQGDFLVTSAATRSLAPGETATFKVTFKPTANGSRNAAIRIKSNDPDEKPFDIDLTGFGVAR